MRFVDYYALLGVQADATSDEIEAAFRRLARAHHPDRNPDDPDAGHRMALLNEARDALRTPARRARYHAEWHLRVMLA